MNIDDLKDAWRNDEPQGMHLPNLADLQKKTSSTVDRIRKNMRADFIATLVSYVVILLFMFCRHQVAFLFNLACILFFIILVLNGYYFLRFFWLYRSISRYDLNTRESLRQLTYQFELNTEIYKTYNFAVAPLAVLTSLTLICNKNTALALQRVFATGAFLPVNMLLYVFFFILVAFVLTHAGISFHIRQQFGRYIKTLKQISAELEG